MLSSHCSKQPMPNSRSTAHARGEDAGAQRNHAGCEAKAAAPLCTQGAPSSNTRLRARAPTGALLPPHPRRCPGRVHAGTVLLGNHINSSWEKRCKVSVQKAKPNVEQILKRMCPCD